MNHIREAVLECLRDCSAPGATQVEELKKLAQKHGKQTYRFILQFLAQVSTNDFDAENVWEDIVVHQEAMSRALGRPVSLQTTSCDFFCSVHKSLKNPTMVEARTYEQTLRDSCNDFLTGLFNRKVFESALAREIARAKRHDRPVSLLLLDLDDFKTVNDSYGHPAGDSILRGFAAIIAAEKRIEDTAARYGGEEFILILPDTDKREGLILAERIRERLEQTVFGHNGSAMQITVSGGLANCPEDAAEAADLLNCADQALYLAKKGGKNKIALHLSEKRRYLRVDFVQSLEVKEFKPTEAEIHRAMSKDICHGGILFVNLEPISIGSPVELTLTLEHQETLTVAGTVLRLEALDDGTYEIGVSFLTLAGHTEHILSRYICRFLCPERTACPAPTQQTGPVKSCPVLGHA